MSTPIRLHLFGVVLEGHFNQTPAGQALAQGLPFTWKASRWGEEYYGATSGSFSDYPGEADTLMEVGDLAYHGDNGWLCLFFGPTPASRGSEPRAALPVQKVGSVLGDWAAVRALADSLEIRVKRAD